MWSHIPVFLVLSSTVSAWRLLLLGQSHIATTIDTLQTSLFSTLLPPALRIDDVCDRGFSNYEGWSTKPIANRRVILEPIPFEALERLTEEGLSVFSLANNHAFDGYVDGIEGTVAAMESVHATYAGTGLDAASAAGFSLLPCARVPTALIALASGGVDAVVASQAKAQDDRPGINLLELNQTDNTPKSADLDRVLNSVRAARQAVGPDGVVLFSHHNHLVVWNDTFTTMYRAGNPAAHDPPAWIYPFVESVMEAGASIYLGHGNPLFQGFAIVKGKPVFYGLGNHIFQVTVSNDATYGPLAYEGIAVDVRILGKNDFQFRVKALQLTPNRSSVDFGLPYIPNATNAQRILGRFLNLSANYGTQFEVDSSGTLATFQLKIAPKAKKDSKAPVAIGLGAAAVLLIGGAGLRRRQVLRARAKATATPQHFASVEQVSMRV